MIIYICFCIILMLFVIAILLACTRVTVQFNTLRIGWFLFIVTLAVFVFYAEPSVSDDLSRHYYNIDRIRQGTYKISDSILWSEYFLFWIIGKIGFNGILPAASVLVFGIVIWRIINIQIDNGVHCDCETIILYLLSSMGGCGIFYIVSGIRYSLAVSIWYLCYISLYKKHRICYYISCIPLLLFHMAMGVVIFLTVLHEYLLKKDKRYLCMKIAIFIGIFYLIVSTGLLIKILSFIHFPYAQYFLEKVLLYVNTSTPSVGSVRSALLIFYYIVFFLCSIYKKDFFRQEKDISVSVAIIAFFCMGNIVILFERLSYILGVSSFPLCSWICCGESNRKIAEILKKIAAIIFSIIMLHSFYMMICHLKFGGIDFRDEIWGLFR